jgi:hypothetical protein
MPENGRKLNLTGRMRPDIRVRAPIVALQPAQSVLPERTRRTDGEVLPATSGLS